MVLCLDVVWDFVGLTWCLLVAGIVGLLAVVDGMLFEVCFCGMFVWMLICVVY